MGKKIKFTLEMKDGVQARTLEDIQQNFDLEKVVGYFSDGRLKTWLEDRYYDEEAKAVEDIDKTSPDFHRKLCESLGVAFQEDALPEVDLEALERRKERLERLKQYTADATLWEKVDQVAFDQEELGDLLDEGAEEIVLCNNSFRILLREKNKKYIGVGHAEAIIKSKEKVDFNTLGIFFSNVKFDAEYEKINSQTAEYFWKKALETEDGRTALEQLLKAADMGESKAMTALGNMYLDGDSEGVSKDVAKGIEFLNKAVDAGDTTAMLSLADWYREGNDYQVAFDIVKKAADAGDSVGMLAVGIMYGNGEGVPEDKHKAMEWYRKAADAGNEVAMRGIGFMYDNGEGVPENKHKAMEWYQKAADAGNTTAMRNIGYVYRFGNGVREDKQKAFEWYQKAADAGDADAMNIVGLMYDIGEGVNKNTHQAAQWYEKAIREGNLPVAMYNLALLRYDDKQYCDPSKIMKLMETAADSGYVDAMIAAGNWYLNGQNVPQNSARGMLWLHKAVEQGSAEAMCDIGYAYDEGNGVSQNYAEAVRWYKMAANAGNATAMRLIAKLYYNGNGVPENQGLAVQWLQRAIDAGDEIAVDWLNEMLRDGNNSNKRNSGCFITTAVCESLGRADDCYELTMFRQFRDTWFRNQDDGESLIQEYYAIAPRIVSNINQLNNAKEIYRNIWTKYLKPCLANLEANDKISCKKRYMQMVMDLEETYLG